MGKFKLFARDKIIIDEGFRRLFTESGIQLCALLDKGDYSGAEAFAKKEDLPIPVKEERSYIDVEEKYDSGRYWNGFSCEPAGGRYIKTRKKVNYTDRIDLIYKGVIIRSVKV